MKKEKLQKVLQLHQEWLYSNTGEPADLCDANLHGEDLQYADLRNANLHGADLCDANLHGADLHDADLRDANLQYADLRNANLHGADLRGANLHGAKLDDADLRNANLHGADLRDADLRDANLRYVIGDGKRVKTVQDKWHIVYTEDVMAIGCQQHTLEDWFTFPDGRIDRMSVDSLTWWQKYEPILKVLTGFED